MSSQARPTLARNEVPATNAVHSVVRSSPLGRPRIRQRARATARLNFPYLGEPTRPIAPSPHTLSSWSSLDSNGPYEKKNPEQDEPNRNHGEPDSLSCVRIHDPCTRQPSQPGEPPRLGIPPPAREPSRGRGEAQRTQENASDSRNKLHHRSDRIVTSVGGPRALRPRAGRLPGRQPVPSSER